MIPWKEEEIRPDLHFPVDIFIQDNLKKRIIVSPHWHDCFEILYTIEGTSMQYINDKSFGTIKHDLIIINEGDIHYTICEPQKDVRILVVKFLPQLLDNSYSKVFESKYILAFLNSRIKQTCYPVDTLNNSTEIHNLLMGLYKEFTESKEGYEIFIKGYIYQLIAYLVRNDVLNINRPSDKKQDLLKLDKLFNYIENHFRENIDLKKAAGMLNLSYYYFSRYFKKITGRNFKQYVDFVRVCEVEKLLLSEDINISQAAYEVGFSNVSSFNRVFKRVRGYTPRHIKRAKTAK